MKELTAIRSRKNPQQTETREENGITVFGRCKYNSLPIDLGDVTSVNTEKDKFELAKFLDLILDVPKISNYMSPREEATASLISYPIVLLEETTKAEESLARQRSRLTDSKPHQVYLVSRVFFKQ